MINLSSVTIAPRNQNQNQRFAVVVVYLGQVVISQVNKYKAEQAAEE